MSVIPTITKLYLKEFFTNYCLSKDTKQQIHAFTVGLEVLEQKLRTFHTSQLKMFETLSKKCDLPTPSIVTPVPQDQEEEHDDPTLNLKFQRVYDSIKNLMNLNEILFGQTMHLVHSNPPPAPKSAVKPLEYCADEVIQEESELYELVAEYRTKNSKLQGQIKELHTQISQRDETISGLDLSLSQAQSKSRQAQIEQQVICDKFSNLTNTLREKDLAIQSLHLKVQELNNLVKDRETKSKNLECKIETLQDERKLLIEKIERETLRKQQIENMVNTKMEAVKSQVKSAVVDKIKSENDSTYMRAALTLISQKESICK